MKKLFLILILSIIVNICLGQTIIAKLTGDTVLLTSKTNSTILKIQNATKNVTNGYLQNIGNGVTIFKVPTISDIIGLPSALTTIPANNGLTNNSGIIQLGGSLINDTEINTGTHYFNVYDTANVNNLTVSGNGIQLICSNLAVTKGGNLQLDSTQMLLAYGYGYGSTYQSLVFNGTGGMHIHDSYNKGLVYEADYSSGATLRWLTDKGYVDNKLKLKTDTSHVDSLANGKLAFSAITVNGGTSTTLRKSTGISAASALLIDTYAPNGSVTNILDLRATNSTAGEDNYIQYTFTGVTPIPLSGNANFSIGLQGRNYTIAGLDDITGGRQSAYFTGLKLNTLTIGISSDSILVKHSGIIKSIAQSSITAGYVPYTLATSDLDLVTTHKTLYAEDVEVGHDSSHGSGLFASYFYNNNVNGKGLLIGAGSATKAAMTIENYTTSDTTHYFDIFGDGHSIQIGSSTAASFIKSGGTGLQILAANGTVITAGTNISISGGVISSTGGSSINFSDSEIPTGSINSSNTAYILAHTPTSGSVKIYRNGLRQISGTDYTISGSSITYLYAPTIGDTLIADYRY